MAEGRPELDREGPAAPPRTNGELAFAAPWQSRVFGITMTLLDAGHFGWDDFRERLIAQIQRAERAAPEVEYSYYACWQAALEALLADVELCASGELDARADDLAARPAGHDH